MADFWQEMFSDETREFDSGLDRLNKYRALQKELLMCRSSFFNVEQLKLVMMPRHEIDKYKYPTKEELNELEKLYYEIHHK